MNNSFLKTVRITSQSLVKDTRGTTLALVAAAIIPMIGVIGGGLDLARAHLVKSRLSQACDSSALAGRRAMSNDDIETAKPEAQKFFTHNFPQGYMGSATFTLAVTSPEDGVVKVAADTSVPTTLMRVFNYTSIPVRVECDATQNFDNIDIVLVLDVTGSMDESIDGEKKIVSLRKAVMALYDELAPAQVELAANNLRLRYSIVPYAMTVNVGKIVRAVNTSYIATEWPYQSRTWDGSGSDTDDFDYEQKTVDVSAFVSGTALNTRNIVRSADNWVSWNGCIEERKTTASITATTGTSASNIPADAFDLDINRIPDGTNATKWGPHFSQIVYRPGHSDPRPEYCPSKEAKRLSTMTRFGHGYLCQRTGGKGRHVSRYRHDLGRALHLAGRDLRGRQSCHFQRSAGQPLRHLHDRRRSVAEFRSLHRLRR